MFEKPQIRVVQDQSVEFTREITGSEAEEILRKYGYSQPQQFSTRPDENIPKQPDLTFEEMIAQQESKQKEEIMRKQHQLNGPKPITFNSNNGYDSETRYGIDDSGFRFKIEITTDMKLPKY